MNKNMVNMIDMVKKDGKKISKKQKTNMKAKKSKNLNN